MSSGKPQTRGLAALLRIEKERRAREESAVQDSDSPSTNGSVGHDGAREVFAPAVSIEPAATNTTEPAPEAAPDAAVTAVNARPPDIAPAVEPPAKGERKLTRAKITSARTASSPPRTRRVSGRPVAASLRGAGSEAASVLSADPGWEKFVAEWKPFLREGVKFRLCEFFYLNTVAAGRREFSTSTSQLSRVSGAHKRHVFLILRQLEEFRFIRKEGIKTNRKGEGLVISFFPDRQA